jgi:hypothetical protein
MCLSGMYGGTDMKQRSERMENKEFEEGYNAFYQHLNDFKTYSCPYYYWTWEATEWEAGWSKANKENENKQ